MKSPTEKGTVLPTIAIIFGITGDLSRRKLLPALWHLYREGMLPKQFRIVGFARRPFDTSSMNALVGEALHEHTEHGDSEQLQKFFELFSYQQGSFNELEGYRALGTHLTSLEKEFGAEANKLFYLSVAPIHYEKIFQSLHDTSVAHTCHEGISWTHILVEKPFGRDATTAQALDEKLAEFFCEEQIYRIDHYLAKETVQNILNFRFSNFIFESIWNKEGIEKVHIELLETLGMEGRGAFYSDTGALRDVGQNHLLQLLAMVAMKNPGEFTAENIRRERNEVLKKLHPLHNVEHNTVRGQYEGFVEETGIAEDSQTETYFKIRAFLDDDVWKDVPFILESGKRMKENRTRITVYFKNALNIPCPLTDGRGCQNTLTFEIKPEEGITVCFLAKKPGFSRTLEQRKLHFSYENHTSHERLPDAYERVLYDGIRGDQTLFTSTQEVHSAWCYVTPLLEKWKKVPLEVYKRGSQGPDSRKALDDTLS